MPRWWIAFAILPLLLCGAPAGAQSLEGAWQGTVGTQQNVFKIRKAISGALRGDLYTRGFDETPRPLSTIVFNGTAVTFAVAHEDSEFQGVLAPGGNSIVGTWQRLGAPPVAVTLERATKESRWPVDESPHKARLIAIDADVSLEVLDWGGKGPPLVFLAGLGSTAHMFDELAPKFADKHHVYGITRRGYGASTKPPPTDRNYDADRLGDDVLAVIDALKLDRPVLAAHSIGGSELSSIGTRAPEKVAGLIYLDAAFWYAVHNSGDNWMSYEVDYAILRRRLADMANMSTNSAETMPALAAEIQALTERFLKNAQVARKIYDALPGRSPQTAPANPPRLSPQMLVTGAISSNERRYSDIKPPSLVLMVFPRPCLPNCDNPSVRAYEAADRSQIDAIKREMRSVRVVTYPYADHTNFFRTKEADVMREMNAFMDGLGRPK